VLIQPKGHHQERGSLGSATCPVPKQFGHTFLAPSTGEIRPSPMQMRHSQTRLIGISQEAQCFASVLTVCPQLMHLAKGMQLFLGCNGNSNALGRVPDHQRISRTPSCV